MLENSSFPYCCRFLAIEGNACFRTVRSVRRLMWFQKWPQDSVLGQLLVILYTIELFRIVGNHIVGYSEDTKTFQSLLDRFPVLK